MNLATAFTEAATKAPEKTAIYWGESEIHYGAIQKQSIQLASWLQTSLGVQTGDRVAIWLKNCPEFVTAIFGILQAGAVVVPINNFLKPQEVAYILQDSDIKVLISEEALREGAAELTRLKPGLEVLQIETFAGLPEISPSFQLPNRSESDLAVIIYTSGTTGRPKGAMLSHGNLLHNVDSCRILLQAVSMDQFVVLLPMFHSFMLCVGIFLPLLVGGSMLLIKSIHPPKNILMEILHRQATILPAIPQFFRALANAPIPPQLPLRLCISGAAPLPVEILKEFNAKFPIPLIEGYGLSEASPVVSMNPLAGPWKAGSIGLPVPNVEMSVQDELGNPLKETEVGEICVRGGNVMQGYWNQPEETAKALKNGWLLTGDVGYRDADGYYYITDRKKDMLLVNGINVYPREIEEIIYQYPGVKEAAVIGKPDPRKGEQAIGFVAMNEGATLDEKALLHFLRERLADYKVPRRIIVLPNLPRNATGKVLKTTLRQLPAE
jgi:long-chain acyl-CoA synthetase